MVFFAIRVLKLLCSSGLAEVHISLTEASVALSPRVLRCDELAGRSCLGFFAPTMTSLVLHAPDVPMGTWRLLGRVKVGFIYLFIYLAAVTKNKACAVFI